MKKSALHGTRGLTFPSAMLTAILFGLTAASSAAPAAQSAQPVTAAAAAAQPSEALKARVNQLVEMLNGGRSLQDFFGPKVPAERFQQNLNVLRERFGAAVSVSGLEATDPNSGTVTIKFENGERRMKLRVESDAPHTVSGFGPAE
jgi:hypothetical protein